MKIFKAIRDWFTPTSAVSEQVLDVDAEIANIKIQLKAIESAQVEYVREISNAQPGDLHPQFKDEVLRQYDIDYAKKLIARLDEKQNKTH